MWDSLAGSGSLGAVLLMAFLVLAMFGCLVWVFGQAILYGLTAVGVGPLIVGLLAGTVAWGQWAHVRAQRNKAAP